jgi:hypothetical protein
MGKKKNKYISPGIYNRDIDIAYVVKIPIKLRIDKIKKIWINIRKDIK